MYTKTNSQARIICQNILDVVPVEKTNSVNTHLT